MALALYRKYRPRTFAEVIGQEHVTEPLMQALRTGRLNHAYLFSGPRGCGKTSSARILARSLNCEQGPTPQPCGECDSCRALAPDGAGSIDVIEIDAASHGGVDDARELRERAFFAPVASRFKVYVIDEAHMVSPQGFNALLKLVEEPPEYIKFVFATTEPDKVLGTIKSRTHHYPFRLMPPGVLRPYLEQLCATEGVAIEPAVLPLVVRAGGGSVRDSLSLLDQLIAGAGPDGVTYARAVALLGVTDVALIDEICDAVAAGDGAAGYATVNQVSEAGHDPRRFASDLLERLRDLIVLQRVPDAVEKGLIDAPSDQLERMTTQAGRIGPATASRLADIVHNGLSEMRGATSPRLVLELLVARMLLPGADDSTGALLQRLERLERGGLGAAPGAATAVRPSGAPAPAQPASGDEPERRQTVPAGPAAGPAMPAPMPVPTAETRPEPAAPAADVAVDVTMVQRGWDGILTLVRRKSQRAWAVVREARVADLDGDTLVLSFQYSAHANMLSNSPGLLVEAIAEVLGQHVRIRCEVSGETPAAPQGRGHPAPARTSPPPRRADPGRSDLGKADLGKAAPVRQEPAGAAGRHGRAPASGSVKPAPVTPVSAAEDWPEAAKPGGGLAGPASGSATSTARSALSTSAAPPSLATSPSTPQAKPPASSSASSRAVARAAGLGAGRPAGAPDEPPFDPDYDRPSAGYTGFGFDPGDEPLDEVIDEESARQTSEEQAITLLVDQLGAEKIGDVPHAG